MAAQHIRRSSTPLRLLLDFSAHLPLSSNARFAIAFTGLLSVFQPILFLFICHGMLLLFSIVDQPWLSLFYNRFVVVAESWS